MAKRRVIARDPAKALQVRERQLVLIADLATVVEGLAKPLDAGRIQRLSAKLKAIAAEMDGLRIE
jgi:hypothetical protein